MGNKTHIDIFSGIGGFSLSSQRAGLETKVFCEIDKFCHQVLKKHWPNVPIEEDVKKLNGEKYKNAFLLTGGFPCFAEGTLILTYEGYKPIENLKKGDIVLTHKGRWKKITSTMQRDNAEIYLIKAQGILPTKTTLEHPYYANGGEWKTVGELKRGDKISQVIPIGKFEDSHNNYFWWLVGRYLADGWRIINNNKGRVVICCNRKESDELAKRIIDAGFNYSKASERTCDKFHITRIWFYKFLEPFGKYAYGKTIPGFIFELKKEKIQSFLDGYFTGDGCVQNNHKGKGSFRRVTTVSKELALGVALLIQKAYGVVANLTTYIPKGEKSIEGRIVHQREMFFVTIPERNKSAYIDGIYGWKHFRNKELIGLGRVYNISVEEDESYIANGAIVHNCQSFSVAGKQKGKEDDRYLWPEMFRIITEARPRWIIGENVLGILNIALDDVMENLKSIGYEVMPVIIPACALNAPHQRNRVWILAHDSTLNKLSNENKSIKFDEEFLNYWTEAWYPMAMKYCQSNNNEKVELEDYKSTAGNHRIQRLKALGNAIVPQVAYILIKTIMELDSEN